jgi:hypothetical protein
MAVYWDSTPEGSSLHSDPMTDEEQRVAELVGRLRRLADELIVQHGPTMTARNAAVAMMDAADSLVDHALKGEEPQVRESVPG